MPTWKPSELGSILKVWFFSWSRLLFWKVPGTYSRPSGMITLNSTIDSLSASWAVSTMATSLVSS